MRFVESRRRLTEAQRALAVKHLPLARSLAKSLKRTFPRFADEIDAAASAALVEAAGRFEASRKIPFPAFARRRIRGALRDILLREVPLGMRKSQAFRPEDAPKIVQLDRDHTESVGRFINFSPDPPVGRDLELADELNARIRSLPPRHAKVCRLIYLHGLNQTETARELKITCGRVCRMHREALEMLAEDLRDPVENVKVQRSESSKLNAVFAVSSN